MFSRHTVLAALFLALSAVQGAAQTEHGGRPPSLQRPLRRAVPTARMQPVRADLLLAEDAAQTRQGPLRFAEVLEVELDLRNSGVWEELGRGDRVWRLRLHSPGAKSLGLVFRRYQLPVGGELYLYDDARKIVRGAYTELENRLDGELAMYPLRGEALTLEYFEPARARGRGELALALVAHDYRGVLGPAAPEDRGGSGGGSGRCEVDVACALADPWRSQVDAAVKILDLGAGVACSGSLLNNTASDGTLLVLSAQHCGSLANAFFTFNYQNSECNAGTAPTTNVLSESVLLVSDEEIDVQLVRLKVPQLPLAFPIFLAGWDRSDVPPASSVIIHHPMGDVKKISLDDDAPGIFQTFWRIRDWERGATEGGSSGAPMFDAAGRFIGNLDSGSSSCVVPTNDDFATRLAVAWPLLEPYLDPRGTGQVTLDGLDRALIVQEPFAATSAFPAQVEALEPGPSRSLRILGTGFRETTEIAIDGVPVDVSRYLRGGYSFLNINMPQVPIGAHVFGVTEGGVTETIPFTVVASSEPRMQAGEGIKGELVGSGAGVDILHADLPGHLHYCFYSLSNVPSVHPYLTLGMGNNFTDLSGCLIRPIPAEGWVTVHHPLDFAKFPLNTRIYSQSACVSHGLPLHTSNMQEHVFTR